MKDPKLIQRDEHIFIFKFPDGRESEKFFWADEFDGGFAIVSKTMDSGFQYLDKKGNLSEEFEAALGYNDGFGLVRINDDHGPQFRDIDGNLSEEFYKASDYKNGYASVKRTKSSPREYRDILGNISSKKTQIGDLAYMYKNGELDVAELPDCCFLDPEFFKLMLKVEYVYAKRACDYTDKNYVKELLYQTIQYITDRKIRANIDRGNIDYPID